MADESDDAFWARLLGDDDPCAPGKDWADRVVTVAHACGSCRAVDGHAPGCLLDAALQAADKAASHD